MSPLLLASITGMMREAVGHTVEDRWRLQDWDAGWIDGQDVDRVVPAYNQLTLCLSTNQEELPKKLSKAVRQ